MQSTSQDLVIELPATASAPGLARRAVQQLGLDHAQNSTLTLLTSELVTNAVRHAGSTSPIRLEASIRGRLLRLCVTDAGLGFTPPAEPGPGGERGGYGLFLVDRLASRWGVAKTTVWFEMPAAAA